MIEVIKSIIVLIMLLSFMSFQGCSTTSGIKLQEIEDCMLLSSSVFCVDRRLNNDRLNTLIDNVQAMDALPDDMKLDLIQYFNDNRNTILKKKEYELKLRFLPYFRGYFLTNPVDKLNLQLEVDNLLKELEKYRKRCGALRQGQMVCK